MKLPIGKFVASNPDYIMLYAKWAEKRFNRSTRQIVRTAKKNGEIVEREYWHGTIAVAGDIHREAVMFREQDRKSVVEGTSVSVRVDLGGRRCIKKKKKK